PDHTAVQASPPVRPPALGSPATAPGSVATPEQLVRQKLLILVAAERWYRSDCDADLAELRGEIAKLRAMRESRRREYSNDERAIAVSKAQFTTPLLKFGPGGDYVTTYDEVPDLT